MTNKNQKMKRVFLLFGSLLIGIFILSLISAAESNVCCEKTKAGAWCQNSVESNCDRTGGLRVTKTSCDASSFCKPGCCADTNEGLCMESTPQKVCDDNKGNWYDDSNCNIAQCNLGCCILSNQASFVTLTRCKKLSGFYGLETNFKTEIKNEVSCIAIAQSQDVGACVFESNGQRTCKFTTRGECVKTKSSGNISAPEFFKDLLCTNDNLSTVCGPTTDTMCVAGKQEVYYKDTCGNPANIYDAAKRAENNNLYWQEVVLKSESCLPNNANINSKTCGNCDYFRGSICAEGSASYGDYSCKDLNCYKTQNGKDYKNGESWCIYQGKQGEGADLVGSRHFRHICINGEEIIEPCDDFRTKVCTETEIETDQGIFTESACRVNRWNNCAGQEEKDDCLNTDKRDCFWIEGAMFTGLEQATTPTTTTSGAAFSGPSSSGGFGTTGSVIAPITGRILGIGEEDKEESAKSTGVQLGGGACVPNNPPGLKFWAEGEAAGVCSLGNSVCVVEYEKKVLGDKKCIDNCECLEEGYAIQMNNVCSSLGDCGAYVNIAGKYTNKGVQWKIDGKKQTVGQGLMNAVKKKAGK